MKKLWWLPILIVGMLAVALIAVASVASASHTSAQLALCCPWNAALKDANSNGIPDLTYSISGGGTQDQATVDAAVQNWATALNGGAYTFELNKVDAGTGENIKITMKKGGGMVAGMAKRSIDTSGFVKSVTISVSLKAFGVSNEQAILREVVLHEFGHALGVNHANYPGDLMDPTVGGQVNILGCDVEGVREANRWLLKDAASSPYYSTANHVGCNADGSFNSLP